MKRLYMMAASVPLLAMLAAAQTPDDATLKKLKVEVEQMVAQSKFVGLRGGVMGATVKGAPYSGVEVSESTQVLADGTRIHNENQTSVYRDAEGRVRRETPEQVTIMDPVAGTTWFLDPRNQTARKAPLGMMAVMADTPAKAFTFRRAEKSSEQGNTTFEVQTKDGVTSVMVDGKPVDPSTVARMKMNGELAVEPPMIEGGLAVIRQRMSTGSMGGMLSGPDVVMYKSMAMPGGQAESLGKQTIEGVNSEGTRSTTTLPAGAIGNDRPIQTVMERWYSPELQTIMMTKHSDPRNGEETFRVTNVNRNEPAPYLFQVASSYQILEGK